VIVQGTNLGPSPGKFLLKLQSGQETSLGRLTWAGNSVGGTIDPNLAGVGDQPGTLQVILPDGWASNDFPVTFTARRELNLLSDFDVQCSVENKGGVDKCNSFSSLYMGLYSLSGYHGCTGLFDPIFGCKASGVDTFWTTLENGWRVEIVELNRVVTRARGGGRAQNPPAIIRAGPGPMKITVWWDTGDHQIQYFVDVYVAGPAGTSYK